MKSPFEFYPEVVLAYQYGSSVKQKDRPPRDRDIAVLLIPDTPAERRFEIQAELGNRLKEEGEPEADVRVLNQSSPIYAFQVVKEGRLLFGDPALARKFIFETLTRYFDYLPIHRFFVERLERRLGVPFHG